MNISLSKPAKTSFDSPESGTKMLGSKTSSLIHSTAPGTPTTINKLNYMFIRSLETVFWIRPQVRWSKNQQLQILVSRIGNRICLFGNRSVRHLCAKKNDRKRCSLSAPQPARSIKPHFYGREINISLSKPAKTITRFSRIGTKSPESGTESVCSEIDRSDTNALKFLTESDAHCLLLNMLDRLNPGFPEGKSIFPFQNQQKPSPGFPESGTNPPKIS